jgi:hypothetical protein
MSLGGGGIRNKEKKKWGNVNERARKGKDIGKKEFKKVKK